MWGNMMRFGTYAYAFREIAGLATRSRSRRMKELQRSKNLNMVLGLTVGTAVGITAGMLVAPRSGRETRAKLASQTNEIMGTLRESAYEAKERARLKGRHAAATVRESAEGARETMKETAERH